MYTIVLIFMNIQNTFFSVKPRECADVDFLKDGVYVIYPRGENQPKRAYCVWQDNRKWTVSFYIKNNQALNSNLDNSLMIRIHLKYYCAAQHRNKL